MHIPVLSEELIKLMQIEPEGVYADCTGGGGGHAALVLEKLTTGRMVIMDRDIDAVARMKLRFASDKRASVVKKNFKDICEVMQEMGIHKFNGLFADFGFSRFQIDADERGFSLKSSIIDMRMDKDLTENAGGVVNKYSEEILAEIIFKYGQERFSRRIAKSIVKRRLIKPFTSAVDLANTVRSAIPAKFHKHKIHPATQTFQALRIHVNGELAAIETLLSKLPDLICTGGRAAFITFHSLEDRLVKQYFAKYKSPCNCPPQYPCVCGKKPVLNILTDKPVNATNEEVKLNPLARSAKIRAAERL